MSEQEKKPNPLPSREEVATLYGEHAATQYDHAPEARKRAMVRMLEKERSSQVFPHIIAQWTVADIRKVLTLTPEEVDHDEAESLRLSALRLYVVPGQEDLLHNEHAILTMNISHNEHITPRDETQRKALIDEIGVHALRCHMIDLLLKGELTLTMLIVHGGSDHRCRLFTEWDIQSEFSHYVTILQNQHLMTVTPPNPHS